MISNRLLVIDDEPAICDFVKDVAEEQGFDVATANNFDQFTAAHRSFEPSVIVLDLRMPEVDGIELLRFLAKEKCRAQIVLISGLDQKVLHTASQLGATHGLKMLDALQKPILVPELERVLGRVSGEARPITERDLGEAISAGELVVHYQPKVKLGSKGSREVGSLEALVRWDRPGHGLVPPDEFIPLAETTGLIDSLTDYVLHAVLKQIAQWRKHGSSVAVAVNLAPQLLSDLGLPDRLSDLLAEYGVDGSALIVEVTESAAMTDAARTMDILTRLRLKGIEISMDDFGTGYSSLVELYRMPFSEMKIDKSFVIDVNRDKEAEVIVRSIVDLGHNLGLKVCAEGVETEEAMDFLRSIKCDLAQGYYISKPLPPSDAMALIDTWAPADRDQA
ncbi:MAG: EAL domain-containing response regulator [Proteobacteria bacterium]|nr:EAL domain-containing response regulator [Pseudomonadota bacterium]